MRRVGFTIFTILILVACGKKNGPGPNDQDLKPAAAILTAPAQNIVCTSGTILSSTLSDILFTWNAATNANSYKVVIKNLLTADSTVQSTTFTQLSVSLARGTPYSWYVISVSDQTTTTAQSAKWKFYSSGPGTVTYAPFPAEITSPAFGQTLNPTSGTLNLEWTGSVASPDKIANYDVYLGTTNTPGLFKSAITNSFLNDVPVIANTTYYWHVVTRDANGNTSDSGLYQFVIN